MKSAVAKLTINTSLIVSGLVVNLEPGLAATFTYQVNRTAACSRGCDGNISVTGTITTDTLGRLDLENFVDWSLIFNSPDYSNVVITPSNSTLIFTRDPLVEATQTKLIYTPPFPGDFSQVQTFSFRGETGIPFASWGFLGGHTRPNTGEALNLSLTPGQPQPGNQAVRPVPEGNGGTVVLGTRQSVPEPLTGLGAALAMGYVIFSNKRRRSR